MKTSKQKANKTQITKKGKQLGFVVKMLFLQPTD
jgi:hypothetical protein